MIDLSTLKGKRVLVTGADGFLGTAVLGELRALGSEAVSDQVDGPRQYDLNGYIDAEQLVRWVAPDYVVHCAGFNGGVGFSRENSFRIFCDNTMMPLNLLWAAAHLDPLPKVLMPVASCAYPHGVSWMVRDQGVGIFPEHEYVPERPGPHPSIEAHGYAKRNAQLACKFAREQFHLHAVTVCPPTLFGPRDRYSPDRSKIMAAMVRRFADAADNNDPEVLCWGSGKPLREYLYVKDAAHLLLQALLAYDDSTQPLNIGGGFEFSIKDTAGMVAGTCGYRGTIQWDTSKPDGQYRKRLDTTRMYEILGEQIFTPFDEALRETVAAYRADRNSGRLR